MNIPFYRPDITEEDIEAVVQTLRSGWITTGAKTAELERELAAFCGTNRAVCLSSQTAAAELTLRLLGIGEGDEVILPAYTYTATCSVVCHVGATPVLVDCAPESWEMDYDKLDRAITHRTKCTIPVDLGGRMCDYRRIGEVVNAKSAWFLPNNPLQEAFGRIVVLADGAHSLGASADGKHSGQAADFTAFSFHAVKNLTTAEGGAVTWKPIPGIDDDWIYRQYRLYSLHGQDRDAFEKTQAGGWEYDVVAPYYKCNMTDMQAALGLSQLKRYARTLQERRRLIGRYDEAFSGLPLRFMEHMGEENHSSGHLYMTELASRDEEVRNRLMKQMAAAGICCNVHYKPLPLLTAYRSLGFRAEEYPQAVSHYCREITLPLYTAMTDLEQEYLIQKYKECLCTKDAK